MIDILQQYRVEFFFLIFALICSLFLSIPLKIIPLLNRDPKKKEYHEIWIWGMMFMNFGILIGYMVHILVTMAEMAEKFK